MIVLLPAKPVTELAATLPMVPGSAACTGASTSSPPVARVTVWVVKKVTSGSVGSEAVALTGVPTGITMSSVAWLLRKKVTMPDALIPCWRWKPKRLRYASSRVPVIVEMSCWLSSTVKSTCALAICSATASMNSRSGVPISALTDGSLVRSWLRIASVMSVTVWTAITLRLGWLR